MSVATSQRKETTSSPTRGRRKSSAQQLPHLLLLPSFALICIIELYPFVTGISYSLHKGTLLGTGAFVGWENYLHLFASADFYHSLYFSLVFALFNVVFSYLIGLGLALFLNLDFPGRGFCRVALLIPWIVPAIVSIVSWKWLIADRGGLANIILSLFGIGPIYFLRRQKWMDVRPSEHSYRSFCRWPRRGLRLWPSSRSCSLTTNSLYPAFSCGTKAG